MKKKLIQSINRGNSTFQDDETKFQVIKVTVDFNNVYFVFYRGVKQSAMKKKTIKRMPTIRDRNRLEAQDKDVIEVGGSIELIIIDNEMYIESPRTLEFTFDYRDHISEKRDENLQSIIGMSFFDDKLNVNKFVEKSNQYMLSRSLASIKPETLGVLEQNFESRCDELKDIRMNIPKDDEERMAYQEKYESLWPLFDHIDVDRYKVRFNEDKPIKPLLHFLENQLQKLLLKRH